MLASSTPLARQREQPGLHLDATRQDPMCVHRDFDLERGDLTAAPDDADADPVGRHPPQHYFVDQAAQQRLLALARHVQLPPERRQLRAKREKAGPVFRRQRLRLGACRPVPCQRVLSLAQLP